MVNLRQAFAYQTAECLYLDTILMIKQFLPKVTTFSPLISMSSKVIGFYFSNFGDRKLILWYRLNPITPKNVYVDAPKMTAFGDRDPGEVINFK